MLGSARFTVPAQVYRVAMLHLSVRLFIVVRLGDIFLDFYKYKTERFAILYADIYFIL